MYSYDFISGCLCSNYAILCLIRASAEPLWILGLVDSSNPASSTPISIGFSEILFIALSGFFAIANQGVVTLRRLGHQDCKVTQTAAVFSGIQCKLLTILMITFFLVGLTLTLTIRFALQYPFNVYRYATGGYCALLISTCASLLAFIYFSADALYFSYLSCNSSVEQKKYEFANILFIL